MAPRHLENCPPDRLYADMKHSCQRTIGILSRFIQQSSPANLFIIKSRAVCIDSARSALWMVIKWVRRTRSQSAFLLTICNVILLCACKKMVRPYTRWIVAFVANVQFWPFPKGDQICDPMGFNDTSSDCKMAIARWVSISSPLPAFTRGSLTRGSVNSAEKTLNLLFSKTRRDYIWFTHYLNFLSGLVRPIRAVACSGGSFLLYGSTSPVSRIYA